MMASWMLAAQQAKALSAKALSALATMVKSIFISRREKLNAELGGSSGIPK
jgi:hypothetical protein